VHQASLRVWVAVIIINKINDGGGIIVLATLHPDINWMVILPYILTCQCAIKIGW
jgi:hypothetical protein